MKTGDDWVAENRGAQKWSTKEQLTRILWGLCLPIFRWSPRICWGWRRWLLRRFGARVDCGVHVYPTARITMPWNLTLGKNSAVGDGVILYALGPISLGARSTVSQGAHLCAGSHDITRRSRPLLKPAIEIGDDAWVCADAFVGPGVIIGHGAVVGARAVVMRNVASRVVVVGNPAREIKSIQYEHGDE